MKITGSGPLIAVPTFLWFLITAYISYSMKPLFIITEDSFTSLAYVGAAMIVAGMTGLVLLGRKLIKCFKEKTLMTDGLYRVCRNPMYAMYVVFIIPGLGLMLNSWLVLTTVIVNYISILIYASREYKFLEQEFGDEYREYVKKVWIKFI